MGLGLGLSARVGNRVGAHLGGGRAGIDEHDTARRIAAASGRVAYDPSHEIADRQFGLLVELELHAHHAV